MIASIKFTQIKTFDGYSKKTTHEIKKGTR